MAENMRHQRTSGKKGIRAQYGPGDNQVRIVTLNTRSETPESDRPRQELTGSAGDSCSVDMGEAAAVVLVGLIFWLALVVL